MRPGPFSDPRTYFPYLAEEFFHRCIYCLLPDVFGGNFEVEHYRPKYKFKELSTDYSNLFYCCRACNGRKGKKWFEPKPDSAYILNPCQDKMANHLWFKNLRVETRSKAGELTEEVLRLNDSASITYRKSIELILTDVWAKLIEFRKKRKKIVKALKKEKDSERIEKLNKAIEAIDSDILDREKFLANITGSV